MRKRFTRPLVTLMAIALSLPLTAAQALTEEEIDAVASMTTVVIGEGLQQGDVEARQEWRPGSGVLVAREGNSYYVLTALHVVRTQGVEYGIRTSDGKVHRVDSVRQQDAILYFGEEVGEYGESIEGYDLAMIRFESDRDYPLAVMGHGTHLNPGDRLYVSGWPDPGPEEARRTRRTLTGELTAIHPPTEDGGYSLLYTHDTEVGMSGGPVFDGQGTLVGIHGQGTANGSQFCIEPELNRHNSCGLRSFDFVQQLERKGIVLSFARPPVDPDVIAQGLENLETADTINDIYADFTNLKSLLRDGPSGGCDSMLLGDPCDGF
ncbi:serine protease [Phormidium yuhuli AB48]|uniref:Serine protease n=1 Tax=Phormidium yuhuli AB48 TaxID=2940671 RepID=A0ABY5AV46_9CYAN|nr:serine protease [Phormidium yuhuli]USR92601.1 serine protease [Phormidium yuhuli AB48]